MHQHVPVGSSESGLAVPQAGAPIKSLKLRFVANQHILGVRDSCQESGEWPLLPFRGPTPSQGLEVAQKHTWPIVSLVPGDSILSGTSMINA